jgi:hypothetical protein
MKSSEPAKVKQSHVIPIVTTMALLAFPSAALANSGTPLMWVGMIHLFVVPRQRLKLEAAVAQARRELERANDRASSARSADEINTARAKVRRLSDTLRKKENELEQKLANFELGSRAAMKRYALASASATNRLYQTMQLIRGELEEPAESFDAIDEIVPLAESVTNAETEITAYRDNVAELTALGREAELEVLQETVRSMFVGRRVRVEAFVESTRRVESDSYQTILVDRLPSTEPPRCRLVLRFDNTFKDSMARYPTNGEITLVAKIDTVWPTPEWNELASTSQQPQFQLYGSIVRIEE